MRNQDFESREASSDVKDLASEGDSEAANGVSASSTSSSTSSSPASSSRSSLTERLQSLLLVGDDGAGNEADLVYDGDELENGVIRWLRALDLQVLGACRAEERLNPFVKVRNVSSRTGDDRLMSQLSQHFDASEVGMLVRCLCVPLVSIRVGKVLKQGNLLCPTTTRGHLNLTLLPSSDMRITFCGDDGYNEKMGVVPHNFECFEVSIEEISADRSGLSFCLKLSMDQVAYFWCSEKSKLHGVELLEKMKRLLQRSPSLSQLTGICQTRLDSFAIHMRAYFVVSTCSTEQPSGSLSDSSYVVAMTSFPQGSELNDVSSSSNTKNSHSRLNIFRPVIGVCSSGPGYLVSAGPTITSTLPPCLLRSCASLTEESMVEKNARETLRMLMASTPTNPQFMQVLNTVQENLSGSRNGMVAARSCELYTGAQGVDVKSNFCLMGFTSSSTKTEVSGDFVTNIENSSWNNLDGDISSRNEKDIGKDVTKESEP